MALLFLPARAPETADEGVDPSEPNWFELTEGESVEDLLDEPVLAADGASFGEA